MNFNKSNILFKSRPDSILKAALYYLIPMGTILLFLNSCAVLFNSGKELPPEPVTKNNITYLADKSDFDSIVNGTDDWVIVFFTEKYCYSCKMLTPAFKKAVSVMNNNDLHFIIFDTYYDISSAVDYEVSGIPAIIIIKEGKRHGAIYGVYKANELVEKFKKIINSR